MTFTPTPGASLAPQVVNVTAAPGGQKIPVICWVAETVLPGELSISAFNADPIGADLPSESVTVANVSGHTLDLTGCTLRDEAGAGLVFPFPSGFMLPSTASVTVMSGAGANTASTLFWGQQRPVWNNDFDTAVLFNYAQDVVARYSYILTAPSARTKIFDVLMAVDKSLPSTPTGVTVEDGDFVVLQPDPMSSIWTGNILRGSTGPAGVGTADWTFPVPNAPMYSLFAAAGVRPPVFVGASMVTQLVSRTSAFGSGGMLTLFINDDAPGAFGTWGFFMCRVRVFRQ